MVEKVLTFEVELPKSTLKEWETVNQINIRINIRFVPLIGYQN